MSPPPLSATTINEALQSESTLRPFPAVASQILSICEDPNVRPRDLANTIQCDPAVSLQVLRIANSSMYGFAGEIRTVDHAIVVLGFRAVKNLAISAAAAGMFELGEVAKESRQRLWKHSLACASISGRLATRVDILASEAFLAGIVHDVGKLVFFRRHPRRIHECHAKRRCHNNREPGEDGIRRGSPRPWHSVCRTMGTAL